MWIKRFLFEQLTHTHDVQTLIKFWRHHIAMKQKDKITPFLDTFLARVVVKTEDDFGLAKVLLKRTVQIIFLYFFKNINFSRKNLEA